MNEDEPLGAFAYMDTIRAILARHGRTGPFDFECMDTTEIRVYPCDGDSPRPMFHVEVLTGENEARSYRWELYSLCDYINFHGGLAPEQYQIREPVEIPVRKDLPTGASFFDYGQITAEADEEKGPEPVTYVIDGLSTRDVQDDDDGYDPDDPKHWMEATDDSNQPVSKLQDVPEYSPRLQIYCQSDEDI